MKKEIHLKNVIKVALYSTFSVSLMGYSLTSFAEDSYAYIAGNNNLDSYVTIIDTQDNSIKNTIRIDGPSPRGIDISQEGSQVYIVDYTHDKLTIIDAENEHSVKTNTLPAHAVSSGFKRGVVLSPDGKELYIAHDPGVYGHYHIDIYNTNNLSLITTIPVGFNPSHVKLSPDGSRLYVSESASYIRSINTHDYSLIGDPIFVGNRVSDITVSSDGSHVYAANAGSDFVTVIDANTNQIINKIDVGHHSLAIAVNQKGDRLYVGNFRSNVISVVDTNSQQVIDTLDVGYGNTYGINLSADGRQLYIINNELNDIVPNGHSNLFIFDTTTHQLIKNIPLDYTSYAFGQFVTPALNDPDVPNEPPNPPDVGEMFRTLRAAIEAATIDPVPYTRIIIALNDAENAAPNNQCGLTRDHLRSIINSANIGSYREDWLRQVDAIIAVVC